MNRVWFKYLCLTVALGALFANFVACGAQMYKIGMDEDMSQPRHVASITYEPGSPNYGLHAPSGWRSLPISFYVGNHFDEAQRQGLLKAMNMWEAVTGKKLFSYQGVSAEDGDSFPDLYSSLNDDRNGNYLDFDWSKTGKPVQVLGTAIWDNYPDDSSAIRTSDVRFNTGNYLIGDSLTLKAKNNKEVVDMQTLALHELGHLLGLAHIDSDIDYQSIMLPEIYIGEGLTSRMLSRGDIERIQRIYGCMGEVCDIDVALKRVEALSYQLETFEPEQSGY